MSSQPIYNAELNKSQVNKLVAGSEELFAREGSSQEQANMVVAAAVRDLINQDYPSLSDLDSKVSKHLEEFEAGLKEKFKDPNAREPMMRAVTQIARQTAKELFAAAAGVALPKESQATGRY